MADETPEPIADTAAFRAFSASDDAATTQPAQRRPSALIWVTAVVVLVAMVAAILATVL
jgi:hypothetical protein